MVAVFYANTSYYRYYYSNSEEHVFQVTIKLTSLSALSKDLTLKTVQKNRGDQEAKVQEQRFCGTFTTHFSQVLRSKIVQKTDDFS